MIEQQAQAMADLQSKVGAAFDRVNAIDLTRQHPQQVEQQLNLHMQPQIQHHAPQQLQHHAPQPPVQHMPQPVPQYAPPPPPPARPPVQHMQPVQQVPSQQMPPQQPRPPVQPYGADPRQRQFPMARPDADILSGDHRKAQEPQPAATRQDVPHFRAPPMDGGDESNFNVPPPGAQVPLPGYSQSRNTGNMDRPAAQADGTESRGWFGLAKSLLRPSDDADMGVDDRSNWDMKSLLAAAADSRDSERRTLQGQAVPPQNRPIEVPRHERSSQFQPPPPSRVAPVPQQRPQALPPAAGRPANRPAPAGGNGGGDLSGAAHTSSRHMIETLQAMAIDLSRFLEDDPPVDLLRRYRNGERNVFARRLATMLGAEHMRIIARKYQEDREFRETVDRYIHQFEALLEQTARSDRENVLVETYLTSQTGKVYVTLASAIGRLS